MRCWSTTTQRYSKISPTAMPSSLKRPDCLDGTHTELVNWRFGKINIIHIQSFFSPLFYVRLGSGLASRREIFCFCLNIYCWQEKISGADNCDIFSKICDNLKTASGILYWSLSIYVESYLGQNMR